VSHEAIDHSLCFQGRGCDCVLSRSRPLSDRHLGRGNLGSITWVQGKEMAIHAAFEMDTGIPVL